MDFKKLSDFKAKFVGSQKELKNQEEKTMDTKVPAPPPPPVAPVPGAYRGGNVRVENSDHNKYIEPSFNSKTAWKEASVKSSIKSSIKEGVLLKEFTQKELDELAETRKTFLDIIDALSADGELSKEDNIYLNEELENLNSIISDMRNN